jgi:hypothetical protein
MVARPRGQIGLTQRSMKDFRDQRMPQTSFSFVVAALVSLGALEVRAAVIWSDDFTGQVENAFPTRDFLGDSDNDWTTQPVSDANMMRVVFGAGEPAPSLTIADNSATAQVVPRLQMSEFGSFSTSSPDTPLLRVGFDWSVRGFVSGTTSEAIRVILRANGSSAAGNQLVIGFNRADLADGDAFSGDLTLYAGSPNNTSNFTPTLTSAIGVIPGVGWEPGFDFGQYGVSDDNDTDDLFYRFLVTYDYTTGVVNGTVTRLALDGTNGQSAVFTRQLNAGLDFSNLDATDVLLIATTNSLTGESGFDNFVFEAIPEPSVVVACLLGLFTLGARRRRAC